MLTCFEKTKSEKSIPIFIISTANFNEWLDKQDNFTKNWLETSNFRGEHCNISLVPSSEGNLNKIIFCINDFKNFLVMGSLPMSLPQGSYFFSNFDLDLEKYSIAWGLGAYQFSIYKNATKSPAKLFIDENIYDKVFNIVESTYLVRDLINTPTEDMGPTELAKVTEDLAKTYSANFSQIIGDNLLKENYASIYTVGRASDDAPRLLDLRWGNEDHPKVTLVGKGVCFDTGGLDIKPSSGMLLMKKDMAGAAHALGLGRMIMESQLPVRLRILIPAVENSIAGNSYRPGDIIKSRKGLTIEIGNTDAEGRVVLADALTEAVSEKPDLLIDMSTLTGAARIAVGTEISAMFTNSDLLANEILKHAEAEMDPIWRLPLYSGYRENLNSSIADINNCTSDSYAGAITAGLFLQEFVPDYIPWLHFDMMAWNLKTKPGKPHGGEAMSLRALFSLLKMKYTTH